jgi:ribose transport system permease protein/L-arabinose transport system permease protein
LQAIDQQVVGLLIALAVLLIMFGILIPGQFFKPVNLMSIGEGVTLIGMTTLAAAVVLILGGLDVSIGSLVGFCSAAAGVAMMRINSPLAGIAAALLVGVLGGFINGFGVTKGKIEPIIVTLATYSAYRGLALLTTGGYAVNVRNQAFNNLGTGTVLGIPIPVVMLLVAIAIFIFLMGYTSVGRNIYAVGGNPNAARLAGVNINRYKLGVYTLAGLMAGFAAIILTSRTKSGQPISGSEGLELQAITAAILGGISTRGGKGTIIGAMLGVLIIGTLNNGMILLSIPTFYQRVARGLLLIIAVLIQNWQMRPRRKAIPPPAVPVTGSGS